MGEGNKRIGGLLGEVFLGRPAALPKGHGNRGFRAINLGMIGSNGAISQHGHYVMEWDSKKIRTARTIKTMDESYPFRLTLPREPQKEIEPSGGARKPVQSTSNEEAPISRDEMKCPEPDNFQEGRKGTKPEKFPAGTEVMTTSGMMIVLNRYDDGNYCVSDISQSEPPQAWELTPKQIWLPSDWPDYNYDSNGNRLPKGKRHKSPQKRNRYLLPDESKGKSNIKPPSANANAPGIAGNTRSRVKAKVACVSLARIAKRQGLSSDQWRVFDQGGDINVLPKCNSITLKSSFDGASDSEPDP